MESQKNAISIFGSCVSRDAFRIAPSDYLELKTYIARQSLHSSISAPCSISKADIKLNSAFQRAMVWHDVCKDTFAVLAADGSKWLMVDLIDERFQLRRKRTSFLTVSSEAKQSGILNGFGGENCSRLAIGKEYFLDDKLVSEDCEVFAKRLLGIYQESHIIIHKAYFTKFYFDKFGKLRSFPDAKKREAERLNGLLSYMYQALCCALPRAAVIDVSEEFYGNENHQWGLATCHFEDKYYAEVMKRLNNIVLHGIEK